MNELGIGKLINGEAERDAIHVAVAPAISDEDVLAPGQRVRLLSGSKTHAIADDNSGEAIGIVDPFLSGIIGRGSRFWIFIFPGTVTGMRHNWEHPYFKGLSERDEHEAWLRQFAQEWYFDFDKLISEASSTEEDRSVVAGRDLHGAGELGDDHEKFWYHLEGYLGQRFSLEHRDSLGWYCSC